MFALRSTYIVSLLAWILHQLLENSSLHDQGETVWNLVN